MTNQAGAAPNYVLLNIASYLTIATVGLVGWVAFEDSRLRWIVIALIALFTLITLCYDTVYKRQYTHFYLALQTLIVTALTFIGNENGLFSVLFFVLSAQSMLNLTPRKAIGWIIAFCVITALASVNEYGWVGILYILPNFGGYAFFATFGNTWRIAQEEKQRSQQMLKELQTAQSQLQELAIVEERNRLAREMHDALGHRLTVAVVQLEGAQRLIPKDPERAARMIEAMREQMKEALADLRRTVATLRSPLADDLPLDAALSRLTQTFHEGTGLTVHLNFQPEFPALPPAHRLALYRAAQETLTNVQRHAVAKHVWLEVNAADGSVVLTTSDDGKGFPLELSHGGFGLRGLRERAAQLGGELRLDSRPEGGAQVQLVLPIES